MTVVIDVRRDDRQAPPRAGAEEFSAHGVLFVHSCASAVAPHLEWALARVFGTAVNVDWASQPIAPGSVRAEIIWHGPQGTAAKIASTLISFSTMRFEVSEDPSLGVEGERYAFTPTLGLFRATIGSHGDVLVHEDRLRSLLSGARPDDVSSVNDEIHGLIGTPWDDELEPFRITHEDSTVRVLHEVG